MPIYNYHGTFYNRSYLLFNFEIEADSPESANAKAEEYFRNEANHESIVNGSERNHENLRMRDLKEYFKENAQVDSAFRVAAENEEEDEEVDVWMSMED